MGWVWRKVLIFIQISQEHLSWAVVKTKKRTSPSWTARPKTHVERSNLVEQELNFERRMTRDADRHADQQSMSN